MCAPHTLVKWLVYFSDGTPTVQGAAGLPSMCTEPMVQDVHRAYGRGNSGTCTDPYSGCTKMPFAYEFSPYIGEVPCAFLDRTPTLQGATALPACVQNLWHRMCTDPTADLIREAVLIRTAGVRKCRLCMSAPHTLVKWLVYFWDRTPKVQGAMGLPRMCTEHTAEVTRPPSLTCIYRYSGCTKMPFAYECSPYLCEVPCAFLESYTYCTRQYGTAQDVYRTYCTICLQSLWLR